MTDVLFTFDTEDYVNPDGADAILRTCQILQSENVRGCFNIVGKLALALEKWGRQDVIEALKYHEINIHSLAHSHHPTIDEYTDTEDFEEARARFMKNELECISILKRVFGVEKFAAAVPPGISSSYVARYGYSELGVPFFPATPTDDNINLRPVSCCNTYGIPYAYYLEHKMHRMKEREILELINTEVAGSSLFAFGGHPNMFIYSEHWDKINFNGKNTPESEWKPCDRRKQYDIDRFYHNFRFLVKAIKNDPRFRIVTYETAARELNYTRTVKRSQIPEIKQLLDEEFFPLTFPESLCLSDIFHACREFLQGKTEHLCDRVYGFLNEPYAITKPVSVSAADMIISAKTIPADGFLPQSIAVGDTVLGTADWLRAALEILCGSDTATVTPKSWQIDITQFYQLETEKIYKSRWVHSDEFEDSYISDRLRLQTWTIRLPAGTARKIY